MLRSALEGNRYWHRWSKSWREYTYKGWTMSLASSNLLLRNLSIASRAASRPSSSGTSPSTSLHLSDFFRNLENFLIEDFSLDDVAFWGGAAVGTSSKASSKIYEGKYRNYFKMKESRKVVRIKCTESSQSSSMTIDSSVITEHFPHQPALDTRR